ncbi:hypothetical protein VTN96DRAFT_2514 [Rasamsonia emersonii]
MSIPSLSAMTDPESWATAPIQSLNSSLTILDIFLAPNHLTVQGLWALSMPSLVLSPYGCYLPATGHPPCYPSPSRSASSRTSSPHSSSLWALFTARAWSHRGQPMAVSARNCSRAHEALGFPNSLPSGYFPNEDIHRARDVDPDTFMSLDEFSRFREFVSEDLHSLYLSLMSTPPPEDIHLTREVRHALDQLKLTTGKIGTAKKMMTSTTKWVLQMYAGEMFERCGGLSLVEKRYLPTGVLAMMRGKKVTWQMVL